MATKRKRPASPTGGEGLSKSKHIEYSNLSEVEQLLKTEGQYLNIYGIFLSEVNQSQDSNRYWRLVDPYKQKPGPQFKIAFLNRRLNPQPGDIVRIHRLTYDPATKGPIVPTDKNVVIWRAHEKDLTPVHIAREPSMTGQESTKVRTLETFYAKHLIDNLGFIGKNKSMSQTYIIACRLDKRYDYFDGHFKLHVSDGTGEAILKVFQPKKTTDSSEHYDKVKQLNIGDYFVASSVVMGKREGELVFWLSANTMEGRHLRKVNRSSILAELLDERFKENGEHKEDEKSKEDEKPKEDGQSKQEDKPKELRRSPRFSSQDVQTNNTNTSKTKPEDFNNNTGELEASVEQFPKYTKFKAMIFKEKNFDFYNVVGQVRGQPSEEIGDFGHWVLQVYDGSRCEYVDRWLNLVKEPREDCLTLRVYRPVNEKDSDKHFKTVQTFKDGDLVRICNVKAQWVGGKIGLELSANEQHNKSIEIIDKGSAFGKHLMMKELLPILSEAEESQPSSQDESIGPQPANHVDLNESCEEIVNVVVDSD